MPKNWKMCIPKFNVIKGYLVHFDTNYNKQTPKVPELFLCVQLSSLNGVRTNRGIKKRSYISTLLLRLINKMKIYSNIDLTKQPSLLIILENSSSSNSSSLFVMNS